MNLILIGLFGLAVGAAAALLTPRRERGDLLATPLLGAAGALVGALTERAAGAYDPGMRSAGWIVPLIGVVTMLAMYRLILVRRPA